MQTTARLLPWLKSFLVRRRRFFYAFGGLLGIFLLMNYIILPLYVNHGSRLSVPTVLGKPLPEAQTMLTAASLQPIEAEVRPDPVHQAGVVVYQNPMGGAIVKEGRRVYLTISGGEMMVSVPLLRGRSLRDAKFSLEQFGLKLGGITYKYSDVFPENTIMAQSVAAETEIARGSTVAITVSRGKFLEETTVPQLLGKNLAEAKKLLLEAGLRVGNITYQPSFDLLPNTIVDQYPRSGEPARQGQQVDLFVVEVGRPTEEIQQPGE
jgi:beta-lactam-binding protein with PASTA domain